MTLPGSQAWRLVLLILMMFTGCATTLRPAGYEAQAASRQVPASSPRSVPSPPEDMLPMQVPVTRAPPLTSVEPSVGIRTRAGGARWLRRIPAAILAVLLWPSELEGEHLSLDWANTLNPVTLVPWRTQEEYDQFWRLPQQEREHLIQASRKGMENPGSSEAAPETRPSSAAGSRRYPNQTCDDAMLDHLQAEKDRICEAIPGESCSRSKTSPKRLEKMPCSAIRVRIQAMRNCIQIRQFIQDECFGGMPDTRHELALQQYKDGLAHCLALEAVNCASSHPMADH